MRHIPLQIAILLLAFSPPLTAQTITRETTLTPGAIFSNPGGTTGNGRTGVFSTMTKGQSFHLDYGITATALTIKLNSDQTGADFNGNLTITFNRLVDGAPDATTIRTAVAALPGGAQAGEYLRITFNTPVTLPAGDLAFTLKSSDAEMYLDTSSGDKMVAGQLLIQQNAGAWKGAYVAASDLVFAMYGSYTTPAARPAPGAGPNIVMILVDDLGWTDISTGATNLGNPSDFCETPNIATLASQGVAFNSCYMQPNCSPTRAALLSGQYAPRSGNGVYNVTDLQGTASTPLVGASQNQAVPAGTTTIAECLRAGGYVTAHMGKYHVGGYEGGSGTYPLNQGFDFNFGGGNGTGGSHGDSAHAFQLPANSGLWRFTDDSVSAEMDIFANPYGTDYLAQCGWPASLAGTAKHLSDAQGDAFVGFLRNHRAGPLAAHPLYVQLHCFAVHSTHDPRADLLAKYQAKTPGTKHNDPVYAGFVEGMDQLVGRVMAALDDPNGDGNTSDSIAQNTVLVFTSDNGGVSGNSPLRENKRTFYEGGLRVPLIVRRPGVYPAGAVTNRMVHAVDFYRTFCQIAGISAGNVPDSVSFTPALNNPTTAAQRAAICYHFPGYTHDVTQPVSVIIKETSGKRYKLIYDYETNTRELYDLTNDLSETRNLLTGNYWDWLLHGTAAQELAAGLNAWLTQSGNGWVPKYPTVRATGALLGPPSPTVPEVTVPFAQTFRITNITPAANPNQLTLSWSSSAGFKYAVDGSSDMTVWTPLQENITATSATTTRTITDSLNLTSPNRFYRARLTHSP